MLAEYQLFHAETYSKIRSLTDSTEIALNVAFFIPIGAAISWAGQRWWWGAVGGCVVSLVSEATQVGIPGRHASVIDVATNTAGAVIGAVIALLFAQLSRRHRCRKREIQA